MKKLKEQGDRPIPCVVRNDILIFGDEIDNRYETTYFSILICVFALGAKAQDMAAVFISMPDQNIPQLENAWA